MTRATRHSGQFRHRFSNLFPRPVAALPALALAGAVFASPPGADGAGRSALDRAVDRVFPALVRITVVMEHPGEGRMEKETGAGSGVIISKDGYIVTNHHVAGKARHLLCRMSDGEEIEARLIGTDALAARFHRTSRAPSPIN